MESEFERGLEYSGGKWRRSSRQFVGTRRPNKNGPRSWLTIRPSKEVGSHHVPTTTSITFASEKRARLTSTTMATTARKQAPRLARPAGRYWKGKAPKDVAGLSSDESDEEKEEVPQEEGDVAFAGEQEFLHAEHDEEEEEEQGRKGHRTGKMSVALKNVNISKEGKVIIAGRQEVGRTEAEGTPYLASDHINDYDSHLEPSEETGEESDEKDPDETDEVCQPPYYISLTKRLF